MNAMPIRLRLTLWYSFIFGLLLVIITTTIYVAHRKSHYSEIDRTLASVSLHIQKEIEQDLREGKPLSQVRLPAGEFSMTGVFTLIKDTTGNCVASTDESIQIPDSSVSDLKAKTGEYLHTLSDPTLGRFRMLIKPIRVDNQTVGYLQSEISLTQIDNTLYRFGLLIAGITGLGLVLAAYGGWILARKALNRVEVISQTAKAIAASQGFQQRVLHQGSKDELGELTETFNKMLESLEKAYESQRRFIADASHELRAPLTTIRGNLDILQRVQVMPEEERIEIINDIRNEAIRMSKMVADLLSLARADAGQETRMQITDLSQIVREVDTEIQTWEKNCIVELQVKNPVITWGDPDLLKQLILILLDNAIRYTPNGGLVQISASEDEGNVSIRVADTGIGISKEDLSLIFDRFFRSENARVCSPEGTGLGLSIAKWIVDQHNGSIIVTSSHDQGTDVQVNLPRIK